MIPVCQQALLNTHEDSIKIFPDIFVACSQFKPFYSNNGLCLTRNGAELDKIFQKNDHLSSFEDIFVPRNYNQSVRKIREEPAGHHFTFIIDGNKYNDLKRGVYWMKPSFSKFQLALHQPNETGDIRGWSNKILNVPSGQITAIRINLSQQKSKDSIREIPIEKRECRFSDENKGLSSFKWYSKVNCLLDCKMEIAEGTCGCRPWDYPTAARQKNLTLDDAVPVCDNFGSSCFNMILSKEMEEQCKRKCIPDCDKINYQIDIAVAPLDLKKRICDLSLEPFTLLEHNIRNYVSSLFLEEKWKGFPPERRLLNIMKDIMMQRNEKK